VTSVSEPVTSDLRRFYSYLSRRRRWQLAALILLMLAGTLAEIATLGAVLPFLALLADPSRVDRYPMVRNLFSHLGATQSEMLVWAGLLFAGITIVAATVRMVMLWASYRFSFGLGADIGGQVYLRSLYRPYTWHVSRNSSEIIAGIAKVDTIVFNIIGQLVLGIVSVMMSLAIIATLLVIDASTAMIAVASFAVLYGVTTAISRRRLRRNSEVIARNQTRRLQAVQEGLGGIRDVLLDGTQGVYHQRFTLFDYAMRRAQSANSLFGEAPRIIVEALGTVLLVVIAYALGHERGGLGGALPSLGALALGAQKLLPQMQAAYRTWSYIHGTRGQLRDVLELLDAPLPEHHATRRVTPPPFPVDLSRPLIALRGLGFRYADDAPDVLSGVDLEIDRGSRIGIVGVTGSGKSTLIDLIMALLPPSEGAIEIEGQLLTPENRSSWQARIAHVPQTIFLSDTTIAENIALGLAAEDIDLERVGLAARQAQLATFIDTLPQGYQTVVGERGVRLSGGQRQRIGLARALYKQTDVLVLDEATSALDDATESDVMDAIRELHDKMTVLIIAHRISTLRTCDWIIQLGNDGEVRRVRYEALSQPNLTVHSGSA
jgi:ABC-type multidrug transport system fused ATPase/permease subunit